MMAVKEDGQNISFNTLLEMPALKTFEVPVDDITKNSLSILY